MIARWGRTFLYVTTGLITASFALNVYWTGSLPTLAFYLPVTRFWELLVGGMLAWLAIQRTRQPVGNAGTALQWHTHALSMLGLLLIGFSVFAFNRQTQFPGWAAVLPVAGTAFMIAAGPTAPLNRTLLSSRLAVGIGLISYPLYLWHWPLFAFSRILLDKPMSVAVGAGLSLLAVALAWLTWRYIERPFRASKPINVAARDAARLWTATIVLGLCGLTAWMTWLAPRSASSPPVRLVAAAQTDWRDIDNIELEGDRKERILFFGDSHMQQYLPRIEAIMKNHQAPVYSVFFRTRGGCAPLAGIERHSTACNQLVTETFAEAMDPTVTTVVIAASWYGFSTRDDYYRVGDPDKQPIAPFAPENDWIFEHWEDQLRKLKQAGKHVVVVGSSPRGPLADPMRRIDRRWFSWQEARIAPISRDELYRTVADVDTRIRQAAVSAGAEFIDPFDWLCDARTCNVVDGRGWPLYKDKTHLRASFVADRLALLDRYVYVSN